MTLGVRNLRATLRRVIVRHAEVDPWAACVGPVTDRAAHGQQVPFSGDGDGGDVREAVQGAAVGDRSRELDDLEGAAQVGVEARLAGLAVERRRHVEHRGRVSQHALAIELGQAEIGRVQVAGRELHLAQGVAEPLG